VWISELDPLHQRVVIENTTNEPQDISGWRLVNPTYAFSHLIPQNTILAAKGAFTFLPRPTSNTPKGKRGSRAATQADAKKGGPAPPGCAYWDIGGRDIQWPMQDARAILRDANGGVVHEFSVEDL